MLGKSLPSYEELLALSAELARRLEQALGRIAELEARLKPSSSNSSDLFGIGVSAGTVAGWVKRAALGIID